jgi:hypothetical protein
MKKQRPTNRAEREDGPDPCCFSKQQQHGCDQFYHTGGNPTPGFHAYSLEYVNALLSGSKLEIQGLQQDRRDDDPDEEVEG